MILVKIIDDCFYFTSKLKKQQQDIKLSIRIIWEICESFLRLGKRKGAKNYYDYVYF